jgi:hypothetical protein
MEDVPEAYDSIRFSIGDKLVYRRLTYAHHLHPIGCVRTVKNMPFCAGLANVYFLVWKNAARRRPRATRAAGNEEGSQG